MNEKQAMVGILFVLLISLFAFYEASMTGNLAQNAYAGNKMYGGMLKKINKNPAVLGHNYEHDYLMGTAQQYLYANREKWVCDYGVEAEKSPYPCVFDESVGKYCCVIPERDPEKFSFLVPDV